MLCVQSSSALTLTPFSRIFRCSQSNCAPAMADHPFFSLADARTVWRWRRQWLLCHLGHTHHPPHHLECATTSPSCTRPASSVMSQLELCSLEKKEALVFSSDCPPAWFACLLVVIIAWTTIPSHAQKIFGLNSYLTMPTLLEIKKF